MGSGENLSKLLEGIEYKTELSVEEEIFVSSLAVDSREVVPGSLFFALSGENSNGSDYIEEAFSKGAIAVICAEDLELASFSKPVIGVSKPREVLSIVAARFFHNSKDLFFIGVTGTNGKTSVAYLMQQFLSKLDMQAAYVGTLGMTYAEEFYPTQNTTPEPITLHSFLEEAASNGVKAAVIEVTSQALVQKRTDSIDWDLAIFTNFSRDHLDLHGTLENYKEIKKSFFTSDLKKSNKQKRISVLNFDDPVSSEIQSELDEQIECKLYAKDDKNLLLVEDSLSGMSIELVDEENTYPANCRLVGEFNLINLRACLASLLAIGFSTSEIAEVISQVSVIPGRLEKVIESDFSLFVDYAHTPDALVKAQESLKGMTKGRLITVFGCGGDRDRGKRVLMGEAVSKHSDYVIVTSDNPRNEDPGQIIKDILPAFSSGDLNYEVVLDRREAIRVAIQLAERDDCILIAGKGHEDYQEIKGKKYSFSDKEESLRVFQDRKK